MQVEIKTFYLELNSPAQFRPKKSDLKGLELKKVEIPLPEYNRFFYTAVGGDYFWVDLLTWTHQQWQDWISRPGFHTWVLYFKGTPAGYFEFEEQSDRNIEIIHFGILPQFFGQGLGGHLLTEAVERAWEAGAIRVWLHTCTLDHQLALKNYLARGFRLFNETTTVKMLPDDRPPGPWPGANRFNLSVNLH
ncbi:GNAT family N-acetyltransferase [candidate division KSB1 bacterium]|nr:GNAT family N-acetyltransferase [candidate division KSB1 bacterium]